MANTISVPSQIEKGVSVKGANPRTSDDIIKSFEGSIASKLGKENYRLNLNEFTGAFYEGIAIKLAQGEQDNTVTLAAGFVDWAIDDQLIWMASARSIYRGSATSAKVLDLNITGTDGYILAKDTRFVAESGNIYILDYDLELSTAGVLGIATSEAKGTGSGAETGEINQLETPIADVFTVSNLSPVADGSDEETFDNLRDRIRISAAQKGGSTTDAIRSEILSIENVEDCLVYENDTEEDITEGGILMIPGSILVSVFGGLNTDIGQKIQDTKAAGIKTYGSEVVNIVSESGQLVPRRFEYGKKIRVYVKIESDSMQDISEGIKNNIENGYFDYINDFLKPGQKVDFDVMESIVFRNYEINNDIVVVTIGIESNPSESLDLEMEFNEMAIYQYGDTEFINLG